VGTEKKMDVAVINIVTHPHSPNEYVNLFNDAFTLKYPTDYRGVDKFILNKPIAITKENPLEGLSGFFHKFTEIDLQSPWMNLDKLETVESEDGEPVVSIPEEMKPNCRTAPFVFFPYGHRFFFPTNHMEKGIRITFSSALIAKALMSLFAHESIREKYGEVTVTVESSEESIEEILQIPSLTKLILDVNLPNPDDLSGEEAEALKRMQDQHAKKMHTVWTGSKDGGIEPDADTKGFMQLSLSNGYVKAEGYDIKEQKVEKKTSEHPVQLKGIYSKGKSALSCVLEVAKNNINAFTKKTIRRTTPINRQ